MAETDVIEALWQVERERYDDEITALRAQVAHARRTQPPVSTPPALKVRMVIGDREVMSATDAARELGVSDATLWNWINAGEIESVKDGYKRFVFVDTLPKPRVKGGL